MRLEQVKADRGETKHGEQDIANLQKETAKTLEGEHEHGKK